MKVKGKNPEIILRDGKPAAVIIDINEYQEILERLEDMKRKPLKFRKLEDFLNEYTPSI